ncbi:MAG: protein-disulfide reductase DsbD domain-containing protein [Sphingobacteriales bacterium]|jgi:hypothetical protein
MRTILFFALAFLSINTYAQGSAKQVTWTSSAKKIGDNLFEVRLTADIKGDYHMYAQAAGVEGPVPTTIKFTPNPLITLNGKVKEAGKLINKYEEAWEGKVNYYEKRVEFIQVVKLKTKVKTALAGKVEFMVCNDTQCLPPAEFDFRVALGG